MWNLKSQEIICFAKKGACTVNVHRFHRLRHAVCAVIMLLPLLFISRGATADDGASREKS